MHFRYIVVLSFPLWIEPKHLAMLINASILRVIVSHWADSWAVRHDRDDCYYPFMKMVKLCPGAWVPAIEQSVATRSWKAVVPRDVELRVLPLSVLVYLFWNACVIACQCMSLGICVLINQCIKVLAIISGTFHSLTLVHHLRTAFPACLLHAVRGRNQWSSCKKKSFEISYVLRNDGDLQQYIKMWGRTVWPDGIV